MAAVESVNAAWVPGLLLEGRQLIGGGGRV